MLFEFIFTIFNMKMQRKIKSDKLIVLKYITKLFVSQMSIEIYIIDQTNLTIFTTQIQQKTLDKSSNTYQISLVTHIR